MKENKNKKSLNTFYINFLTYRNDGWILSKKKKKKKKKAWLWRYEDLPEKEKKWYYGRERYKNLPKVEKHRLTECRRNYFKMHKKTNP